MYDASNKNCSNGRRCYDDAEETKHMSFKAKALQIKQRAHRLSIKKLLLIELGNPQLSILQI